MASKNEVTLTFAGDSDQLEKAFDRVGESAKDMEGDVGKASKSVGDDTHSGFDRAGEAADDLDTKAMGFRDTMTGVQDTMGGVADIAKGNLFEGFLTLGMGVGDLGSGIYNFLVPGLKGAVTWIKNTTVAQRLLNIAMRLNPVGLIITALALLAVGLVIAYKKSETFRNIVNGAFRGVQKVVSWVWGWIKDHWRLLLGILTGPIGIAVGIIIRHKDKILDVFRSIPGKIRGFFSGLASVLTWPFRQAVDGLRSIWNSTIGGKGLSIPSWVPKIGGNGFTIPYLHTGGVVPGAPGQETLAMLQAGERVTRASAAGSGVVIEIHSGGSRLDDLLVDVLRKSIRVKGGSVQAVLGT